MGPARPARPARRSLRDRWTAAQRLRLAGTRPSTPQGDVEGEGRLYADVVGPSAARAMLSASPGGRPQLAARTQVVDAEVSRAVGRRLGQIVLLGCGYDGRALRFADGLTRWFEVDRPGTLADKGRRLAVLELPSAGVTDVGADLAQGASRTMAALDAAGHDGARPSLFVCESAFCHLTLELVASYCEAMRARAPTGSILVATFLVTPAATTSPARALRRSTSALSALGGEPRGDELRPGDPEKLVVVTGWHAIHSEATTGDRRAHQRILVCEPAPTVPTRPVPS